MRHWESFFPATFLWSSPLRTSGRFAQNASIRAFVDGVTAAAVGAIAGAAFVLGRRAIHDIPTALIASTRVRGALALQAYAPNPP